MTDFANGKIQAFVGPQELGASDDLEKVIINFIKGAKDTRAHGVRNGENKKTDRKSLGVL